MTELRFAFQAKKEPTFTTTSAITEPKHFTNSSFLLEGAVEFEMEWDNFPAYLHDIPEEDWKTEDAFLLPSIVVATCEAVTATSDNNDETSSTPDLSHLPDQH